MTLLYTYVAIAFDRFVECFFAYNHVRLMLSTTVCCFRRQMPPTHSGQLTMEKTPSYYVTAAAPQRIYNMSRDVKLLVVVRNPVTRAISDYVQALQRRPTMPSFEHMTFLDGDDDINNNNNYTRVNTSWGGVRIGLYVRYVNSWLQLFERRQLLFVDGEQLISRPADVMARVQRFLQLPQAITQQHFIFNATKGFPCLRKPGRGGGGGNGRPHCLSKAKGRAHPQVDPRAIDALQRFYRPFNLKLFQTIGETFDWYT